ncbi:hypothetical protein CHS0354_021999 [Potamilus streckersoni]|uniref:VWFA domain-containing protein n=1 Tax=Potamilus streckersoni TaxID=2493646 RepID=A0AAE0VY17_9BIVA|nr:hypothetical protein CHS0354_021999 [Potamilus streckersoni]
MEDFKNISAKDNVVKQKNENSSRKANLIKYEHVQSKGHTNYLNLQKKEIVKTDGTPNIESNFVKTEISADNNRNKNGAGTIPGPALSSTAKTYPQANASLIVPNHLPKEYWESVCQETYDKALKIGASRSIGFDTIICLDTSMSVAEYWGDILDFLRNLINEIEMAQPMEGGFMEHIALVTFGHETCALQHFTPNYQEVLTQLFTIYPEGSTPLYWGVRLCRAILLGSAYVPKLRDFRLTPRLLLITDGRPTYRLMTGGTDEYVQYDEDKEKEDVAEQLISISMRIPLFRVYPVAVGNNCDMEFLTAIAHCCGGKVMTLSDWSSVARYGKTMELASKYFGLASLSEDLLVKVLKSTSGLSQEDIEFITTEVTDQLEHPTNEGTTSDEEEVEDIYQFPPVGSRVRRGPHWSRNDEDNAGPGTIIAYSKGKAFSGWLIVEWDMPKKYGRWQFRYRYGAENAYDVKIQEHEGPRVMEHSMIMGVGCEIIRGSHRKSNDDGIEEGTIGIVYRTHIAGANVAKIRWQNGKRVIYGIEALTSGEIRLSPRSLPSNVMWPFDPSQFLLNLRQLPSQPWIDNSRRQPLRQESIP